MGARRTWFQNDALCASVRAAKAALPTIKQRELAKEFGVHRNSIGYFLSDRCKAGSRERTPPWHTELFEACRTLATGNNARAAGLFGKLIEKLMSENPPELFPAKAEQQLSPRLAWKIKHQIKVVRRKAESPPVFAEAAGKLIGRGENEDEALGDFGVKNQVPLWNEEGGP